MNNLMVGGAGYDSGRASQRQVIQPSRPGSRVGIFSNNGRALQPGWIGRKVPSPWTTMIVI